MTRCNTRACSAPDCLEGVKQVSLLHPTWSLFQFYCFNDPDIYKMAKCISWTDRHRQNFSKVTRRSSESQIRKCSPYVFPVPVISDCSTSNKTGVKLP